MTKKINPYNLMFNNEINWSDEIKGNGVENETRMVEKNFLLAIVYLRKMSKECNAKKVKNKMKLLAA